MKLRQTPPIFLDQRFAHTPDDLLPGMAVLRPEQGRTVTQRSHTIEREGIPTVTSWGIDHMAGYPPLSFLKREVKLLTQNLAVTISKYNDALIVRYSLNYVDFGTSVSLVDAFYENRTLGLVKTKERVIDPAIMTNGFFNSFTLGGLDFSYKNNGFTAVFKNAPSIEGYSLTAPSEISDGKWLEMHQILSVEEPWRYWAVDSIPEYLGFFSTSE